MRHTVLLAAAATLAAPAAASAATDYPVSRQYPETNLRAAAPSSGLTPCSQRLTPAFNAELDPQKPVREAIQEAFDPREAWSLEDTVRVLPAPEEGPADPVRQPMIQVNFPQNPVPAETGSGSPRAGGGFIAPVLGEGAEHVCLSYQIRFPEGFSFTSGGRLPGLYGGAATKGTDEAATNGFTLRPAWREDGEGEVIEYIINGGANARYGLSVGAARWPWEPRYWHTYEQEIVLNTPGEADGIARVWVDGKAMLEQTDIVWREQPETRVNGLLFSVFFDNLYWNVATPDEERIYFSDIRLFTGEEGDQTAQGQGD